MRTREPSPLVPHKFSWQGRLDTHNLCLLVRKNKSNQSSQKPSPPITA